MNALKQLYVQTLGPKVQFPCAILSEITGDRERAMAGIDIFEREVRMEIYTKMMDKDFALYQNHPNPFNPTTNIEYKISTPSQVNLSIYNITGQKITTLLDEYQEAGHYLQRWNGRMDNGLPAPSGVYFYKIVTRNSEQTFVQTGKMILSK